MKPTKGLILDAVLHLLGPATIHLKITSWHSLARLCWEPLGHFLLIGAALFLYFDLIGDKTGEARPQRIHIFSGQVAQLAANFERSRMYPPTPAEVDAMAGGQGRVSKAGC